MLKIDVLADKQRLYPHPVLPVTSVTESVRQTLGFAAIFEAMLIRLLLAQRPRRSRRTTSRQGKGKHLPLTGDMSGGGNVQQSANTFKQLSRRTHPCLPPVQQYQLAGCIWHLCGSHKCNKRAIKRLVSLCCRFCCACANPITHSSDDLCGEAFLLNFSY